MVATRRRIIDLVGTGVRSARLVFETVSADVASALPAWARLRLYTQKKVIAVRTDEGTGEFRAILPDGRQLTVGEQAALSDLQKWGARYIVRWHAQERDVLSTSVRVPRRAASQLDLVMRANISVWTPFSEDAVYFAAKSSVEHAGGSRETTRVILLRCLPKYVMEPWLKSFDGTCLAADEIALADDPAFTVALSSKKQRRFAQRKQAVYGLGGLAILQLVVIAAILDHQQRTQVVQIESKLEELRRSAHVRAAQQEKTLRLARSLSGIRERAIGPGSITFDLDHLARVLPPGATYREVNLTPGRGGTFSIVSPKALDVVSLVAGTGQWTTTEVNQLASAKEGEYVYSAGFRLIHPENN